MARKRCAHLEMVNVLGDENEIVGTAQIEMMDHVEMMDDLRSIPTCSVTAEDALLCEVSVVTANSIFDLN